MRRTVSAPGVGAVDVAAVDRDEQRDPRRGPAQRVAGGDGVVRVGQLERELGPQA